MSLLVTCEGDYFSERRSYKFDEIRSSKVSGGYPPG